MAKTVFDVLMDKIDEDITSLNESLGSGTAKDFAEYKYTVGKIRGLSSAKYHIEALNKSYMEDED